jgi:hypothetical protein
MRSTAASSTSNTNHGPVFGRAFKAISHDMDSYAGTAESFRLSPTTTPSVVTPSPIYTELGALNNEVARLHKFLDELGSRLGQVSHQARLNAEVAEKEPEHAVGLAAEIAANRRGVSEAANKVRRMTEQLAL